MNRSAEECRKIVERLDEVKTRLLMGYDEFGAYALKVIEYVESGIKS